MKRISVAMLLITIMSCDTQTKESQAPIEEVVSLETAPIQTALDQEDFQTVHTHLLSTGPQTTEVNGVVCKRYADSTLRGQPCLFLEIVGEEGAYLRQDITSYSDHLLVNYTVEGPHDSDSLWKATNNQTLGIINQKLVASEYEVFFAFDNVLETFSSQKGAIKNYSESFRNGRLHIDYQKELRDCDLWNGLKAQVMSDSLPKHLLSRKAEKDWIHITTKSGDSRHAHCDGTVTMVNGTYTDKGTGKTTSQGPMIYLCGNDLNQVYTYFMYGMMVQLELKEAEL